MDSQLTCSRIVRWWKRTTLFGTPLGQIMLCGPRIGQSCPLICLALLSNRPVFSMAVPPSMLQQRMPIIASIILHNVRRKWSLRIWQPCRDEAAELWYDSKVSVLHEISQDLLKPLDTTFIHELHHFDTKIDNVGELVSS